MSTEDPTNPELERAIAENPDDPARFAAYTTWLAQRGSPRAELAEIQRARESADSDALAAREDELRHRHAELLRGTVEDEGRRWYLDDYCSTVGWRGGFWRTIRFSGPPDVLAAILAHPSARLVCKLAIDRIDGDEDSYARAVAVLAAAPRLEGLRTLCLGDMPEGQSALSGFGDRRCGDLDVLGTACPRLETLRLLCPHFRLGDHPALRHLDARLGAAPESVASIARVRLPRLDVLELGFDDPDNDEPSWPSIVWDEDALDPLLDGVATPALRVLRLWGLMWAYPEDFSSPFVARVRASPLGRRLEAIEAGDWESLGDDAPDVYFTD